MVSDASDASRFNGLVSLNPCSNGIWSLTPFDEQIDRVRKGLNPCSNGIWSLTWRFVWNINFLSSLNPCSNGIWSLTVYYHGLTDPSMS